MTQSETESSERDRNDKKYFFAMFFVLFVGVVMGLLGTYQGQKLNDNQIRALKNHDIIIRDYEKLIKLHNASLYVIDRFLAQEKELLIYHNQYIREHEKTQAMVQRILDHLQERVPATKPGSSK